MVKDSGLVIEVRGRDSSRSSSSGGMFVLMGEVVGLAIVGAAAARGVVSGLICHTSAHCGGVGGLGFQPIE